MASFRPPRSIEINEKSPQCTGRYGAGFGPVAFPFARVAPVAAGTLCGAATFKLDARGMTFVSVWNGELGDYRYGRSSPNALPQQVGCAALAAVGLICAWALCADLVGGDAGPIDVSGTRADRLDFAGGRGDKLVAKPRPSRVSNAGVSGTIGSTDYAALFDPNYMLGHPPETFAGSVFDKTQIAEAFVGTTPPSDTPQQPQNQIAMRAPAPVRQAQNVRLPPPDAVAPSASAPTPQIRTLQVSTARSVSAPPESALPQHADDFRTNCSANAPHLRSPTRPSMTATSGLDGASMQ